MQPPSMELMQSILFFLRLPLSNGVPPPLARALLNLSRLPTCPPAC